MQTEASPSKIKTPTQCPTCGASIRDRQSATKQTFAAAAFECGGEFIAFGAGETKSCRTGRWHRGTSPMTMSTTMVRST